MNNEPPLFQGVGVKMAEAMVDSLVRPELLEHLVGVMAEADPVASERLLDRIRAHAVQSFTEEGLPNAERYADRIIAKIRRARLTLHVTGGNA